MPQFDETFWTTDGRQLQQPDLSCLTQNAALYETLLLQIRENISYDETGIWITDAERGESKFDAFFHLAADRHVDLAVTPEYSCPWYMISRLIREERMPERQRLWIAGCQSISAARLSAFITAHPEVVWVVEQELIAQHLHDERFFDPVCLLLKTMDQQGQEQAVIIVQFKNEFFGGAGFEWEQENMIPGTKFYVLSNRVASTKLIVQICSDALLQVDFQQVENRRFLNTPLLLVHIQLNQSPFQANYKHYRTTLFTNGSKDDFNKEVICLNWARGIMNDDGHDWNVYGGSAVYMKTTALNFTDPRFNGNHALGLYYSNWHTRRSHIYFFGYNEQVYLLRSTKPSQLAADGTQMRRSGPQLTALFHWDNGWQSSPAADDGFEVLCATLAADTGDLTCMTGNPLFLDVERLLELSLGALESAADWSRPDKLSAMRIQDDELNNRTNFTHDPSTPQAEARTRRLLQYGVLKNSILTMPANLPAGLQDVRLGYDQTVSPRQRYLLNLHSQSDNRQKGTGIFLGLTTREKALKVRDRVVNLLQENQQSKRVIVWYQNLAGIATLQPDKKPEIAENTSRKSNSYKKTRP